MLNVPKKVREYIPSKEGTPRDRVRGQQAITLALHHPQAHRLRSVRARCHDQATSHLPEMWLNGYDARGGWAWLQLRMWLLGVPGSERLAD